MNGSNFEPFQNQMHMLARDIVSIDDFLSHLTIPPVLSPNLTDFDHFWFKIDLPGSIPQTIYIRIELVETPRLRLFS